MLVFSKDFTIQLLLAVLLFFPLKYLIGKWIKSKLYKNTISIISALALSPLVFRGVFVLYLLMNQFEFNENFSKENWIEYPSERHKMAENIIETNMLIGEHKKQVSSILGDPDVSRGENIWNYNLGYSGRGLSSRYMVLLLNFKEDTVQSVDLIAVEH
ncbi:MAG: hypothetical protein WBA74_04290 [Cyclobacteriaceae bacterium]